MNHYESKLKAKLTYKFCNMKFIFGILESYF
jgi:hypothetical protein